MSTMREGSNFGVVIAASTLAVGFLGCSFYLCSKKRNSDNDSLIPLHATPTMNRKQPLDPVKGLGGGVPIIDESVVIEDLPLPELQQFVRLAKDAYTEYFPEGQKHATPGPARILLAKHVSNKAMNCFVPIKARYLRDENLDLYIRKVPGDCHGSVHSELIGQCWAWRGDKISTYQVRDAVLKVRETRLRSLSHEHTY